MRNVLASVLILGAFAATCGTGCFNLGGLGDDDGNGDTSNASDSGASDSGASTDGASSSDGAIALPPTHAAAGVRFVDVDPNVGKVGGVVVISHATDESDVTSYVIYLADASGAKVGTALAEIPASGKDLILHVAEGSSIPAGVANVLVVTKNAGGEMATGSMSAYADATIHVVSLASFAGSGLGVQTRIQFDAVNRKLIVLGGDGIYLYCSLDGTTCTKSDVTNGHEFYDPPKPQIDLVNDKVLIPAQTYTTRTNTFVVTSTLDGTATPAVDITDPTVQQSGTYPATILDPDRSRLYVVPMVGDTAYGTNLTNTSVLYDCDLGITGCNRHDISVGTSPDVQAAEAGHFPSVALDRLNHNLIVATYDESAGQNAFILVCPTAGGACTGHANVLPTSVWREQSGPFALIDEVDKKLVLVAGDETHSPQIVRCELDGTLCSSATTMTSATGLPDKVVAYMSAVAEPVEHKVVAVGLKGTNDDPELFRCGMDGNDCAFVELIPGAGTYHTLDVTTDPVTGQSFVVTASESAGLTLVYMQ